MYPFFMGRIVFLPTTRQFNGLLKIKMIVKSCETIETLKFSEQSTDYSSR